MEFLLATLLVLAGDPAPAGTEYTRGMKLLAEKNYAEAARAFEAALTFEPVETPALKYRDPDGRHRFPYYPYYFLGRARLAQAEAETSLDVKRDRLQSAMRTLGQSMHAEARPLAVQIEKMVAKVEEEIVERDANTPPPEINALRVKATALCESEKFEEALAEVEAQSAIFTGNHVKQKPLILTMIRERQKAVLKRYDDNMISRLESMSRADPTLEAESIPPLLKPACVPPEVEKNPAPHMKWLYGFLATYEKQIDKVSASATLDVKTLLETADLFEKAAEEALDLKVFNGFKAAHNMAHAMRMARIKQHTDETEGEVDASKPDFKPIGDAVLQAATAARLRAEAVLRAQLEANAGTPFAAEIQKYLGKDIPNQARFISRYEGDLKVILTRHERHVLANGDVAKARGNLVDRKVMSDPDECKKVEQDLNKLEAKDYFASLNPAVRARTLYTRAVAVATSEFLEGADEARVVQRCRNDLNLALSLDAKVGDPWQETLSPRIKAVFEKIRKAQ